MGATVKVEQVQEDLWRVSIIRQGRPSCIVEADHEHTMELAWRAASLIPYWDDAAASESLPVSPESRNEAPPGPLWHSPKPNECAAFDPSNLSEVAHRYAIVDPTAPAAPGSASALGGAVVSSFASLELAEAFAEDEIRYGNRNVVVIDRRTRRRVYPL